jgi:hypothetical protein
VVIDEVQDITTVQLALVLKTLRKPGHFLLCGDSNQIVHPNFFSWSQVKSLFWKDPKLAERQELRVLTANFRNGLEATRVANQLLKIKHKRFGSIDRESNFLVQAVGGEAGQVALMPDKDATTRELDQKIRQSTQFAVLVMRDEDKAEARKHFATPLLFSIHEAKGLEYENIVLYRFISDHRSEFSDIVEGVAKADLAVETLDYRRARDKSDKSLEVYKFFVNALYVALTRAIKNIYVIESDTGHALFGLLDLNLGQVNGRRPPIDPRRLAEGSAQAGTAGQAGTGRGHPPHDPQADAGPLAGVQRNEGRRAAGQGVPRTGSRRQAEAAALRIRHLFDEPQLAEWLVTEAKFEQAKTSRSSARPSDARPTCPTSPTISRTSCKQCEQPRH